MSDLFDIHITNALLMGFFHNLQYTDIKSIVKDDILKLLQKINNNDKVLIERIKQLENFGSSFIYGCINDVRKRLDKMDIGDDIITRRINNAVEELGNCQQDLNNDIINLINHNFSSLSSNIDNKLQYIINEVKNMFSSYSASKSPSELYSCKKKKGRNSVLTEEKKYCNCKRSQN